MDENRHRHTVWMDDNVWVHVESHYQRDNCTTKNEFIEKAVRFYSGYLDAESAAAYLLRALSDVLEGKLGALGKRMGRLLAVEQSPPPHQRSGYLEYMAERPRSHGLFSADGPADLEKPWRRSTGIPGWCGPSSTP